METTTLVSLFGLVIGVVFGYIGHWSHFCTLGAVADLIVFSDGRRMRSWILAIGVAILGTQILAGAGLVDFSKTIYGAPAFSWTGTMIGGVMFGFGMALSGGCISRNLVRLGGGSLKALVVILIAGLVGYMALHGLIKPLRDVIANNLMIDLAKAKLPSQSIPAIIAHLAEWPPRAVYIGFAIALGGTLTMVPFFHAGFRASGRLMVGGLVVGLAVVAGWWATAMGSADLFEPQPVRSLNFLAPVGDSIVYLMLATAEQVNFSILVVAGVVLGAFLSALIRRKYRVEAFIDASDMGRHIVGAAAMGMGGAMALGCSIGQGVTGMSSLAIGSLIALIAMGGGAAIGVSYLVRVAEAEQAAAKAAAEAAKAAANKIKPRANPEIKKAKA